jgi:hypothetical protein
LAAARLTARFWWGNQRRTVNDSPYWRRLNDWPRIFSVRSLSSRPPSQIWEPPTRQTQEYATLYFNECSQIAYNAVLNAHALGAEDDAH